MQAQTKQEGTCSSERSMRETKGIQTSRYRIHRRWNQNRWI